MTTRFTAAQKEKGLLVENNDSQVKRIRAPPLDTAALIEENGRTLIGRLTNPKEQRLWALIPSLPRKWNVQSRVVGSDLGNNCFQFRFEEEEDLQRVLENRPYHFGYWMLILERWKPIIADTFPSEILFWIKIKGLPLHFWHKDLICRIGRKLGAFEKHELTKTSARVRVSINGLKPLVKETIVEFDTGEESRITLEYERLENHCTICLLLSHRSKHCPSRNCEQKQKDDQQGDRSKDLLSYHRVENRYYQTRTEAPLQDSEHRVNRRNTRDFNQRVDRHGRAFGERISTRHTRNPPPLQDKSMDNLELRPRALAEAVEKPKFASPPYAKNRRHHPYDSSHRRSLFQPQETREWRRKPVTDTTQEVDSPAIIPQQ